ncbi:MAG: conjugal transfer protein TraG N-terminal domain-containing protein [Burkholderiales bacterium]
MTYTIYSYWNITELTGVFNAVAALVGSSDFGGAIKFLVLVAILSLAMTILAGRGKMEEFWQWTIMVALLNGFLLVPKATVQIVDQTGTNPPAVVANVPIGLAAVASGISSIGYWLTTSYETIFALPGDLNFEENGMMFGQKVQQEMRYLKPATVAWQNDFNNYYSQCLAPDILNGTLTQDQINTSSNIWSLLGNTNAGIFVTLSTVGTVNCPAAYNDLTTRLTSSEVPTTLQNYAVSALPQTSSPSAAVTGVSNTIVDSNSYFYNIATSANAAVQQGVVANAIIDAHCNMLSQTSNTALANECLTQSEGFRQTNSSYRAMANIAESSMPKVRNAIELIQYAIFPIILIFVIVAGHRGMTVLKTYVMSLMWIQLWPPLYAVVNYMMNVHASYWANSTQGNALALQYQQWVTSASVSDQAIAGMLTLSIPAIAAAIVKGGDIGMQAIGSMASPPHSVEKLATQMTEGNFQNGQMKTAADVTTGAPVQHQVSQNGSIINTAANGRQTYDKGIATTNANFKATGAAAYSASLGQASTTALGSSQTASQQAGTEMAAGFNSLNSFVQRHGHDAAFDKGDNLTKMGTISNANAAIQSATDQFAQENHVSQAMATSILADATAGLSVAGMGAKLEAQGKSSAEAGTLAKNARTFATTRNLSQQVSNALNASRGLTFDDKNSAGAEGAQKIDASLSRSQKYQETAANEMHQSEELANKAEMARKFASSLDVDLTTAVMNKLQGETATIDGHTYHGFKPQEIDSLMRNGDPAMAKMAQNASESIMNDRISALVSGKTLTPDQIKADYAGRDLKSYGTQTVEGANAQNQHAVTGAQNKAGDNPNQGVGNPIGGKVHSVLATTGTAATPTTQSGDYFGQNGNTDWDGKPMEQTPTIDNLVTPGEVNQQGRQLTGSVEDKLNNSNLVAAAGENAFSSVAPDATAHLAKEYLTGNNPSGNYFNKSADKFKGNDLQAGLETAGWVADIALAATDIGGATESIAEKYAEKLGVKAAESATAKVGADETLATSTQEATDAGQNLAAKQADAETAEAKYTGTDKTRFGPDDTPMQHQLRQDKLAMDRANSDVEAATARSDATQDSLTTSQATADKAATTASDDAAAANKARRNVPDAKTLGWVLGGAIGAKGGKVLDDHLDESSASHPSNSDMPPPRP